MTYSKKIIIICVLILCCSTIFSQNAISEPTQWPQAPYRLFSTRNVWTFLELDTITGRIWQVHYSLEDNGTIAELDIQNRASGKERIPGRFTLHPTANMFNFILHDQINGRSWQVQWSWEEENRGIIPIF